MRDDELCVLYPILHRDVLHLSIVYQSEATVRQQQDIAGVRISVEFPLNTVVLKHETCITFLILIMNAYHARIFDWHELCRELQ